MEYEERRLQAHSALLSRFLGYVVGALAGFLPLLEFSVDSDLNGRLALPLGVSVLFVVVGSIVTVLLTGAALVSFRQAIALEHAIGIEPGQFGNEFLTNSITARIVHRAYTGSMSSGGRVADLLVDVALSLVVVLTVLIDVTLPWHLALCVPA